MATPLAERRCVKCAPGTPPIAATDVPPLLAQLPGWSIGERDGHQVLTRRYDFKGFMPGVDLVNRIAAIAEAEGHHPDLELAWGHLMVTLWTHAAGGLTENDFIVAAKLDHGQSSKS